MKIPIIIWKEEDMYIVKDAIIGITTQGKTIEEAIENMKEALELYFEEKPEDLERIQNLKLEGILNVEVAIAVR